MGSLVSEIHVLRIHVMSLSLLNIAITFVIEILSKQKLRCFYLKIFHTGRAEVGSL
jgi:hypothetical protein